MIPGVTLIIDSCFVMKNHSIVGSLQKIRLFSKQEERRRTFMMKSIL